MNLQESLKKLAYPKSLVRRTQIRDKVEGFTTKTFDRKTLCLDVYEKNDDKWYVISTTAFSGWTRDAQVAFDIYNNAEFYRLKELHQMTGQV